MAAIGRSCSLQEAGKSCAASPPCESTKRNLISPTYQCDSTNCRTKVHVGVAPQDRIHQGHGIKFFEHSPRHHLHVPPQTICCPWGVKAMPRSPHDEPGLSDPPWTLWTNTKPQRQSLMALHLLSAVQSYRHAGQVLR